MKLTFVGAAHEVTGSCHFLQVAGKNVLVDCGMEQGPDLYENPGLPISATEVDYVFLTHAHIDHSGMLPKLVKDGFKGQIFTTYATADLCDIMLRDSAHIQEFEAEWRNRKGRRAGKPVGFRFIQGLANQIIASLGMMPVTASDKRRQQESRVE